MYIIISTPTEATRRGQYAFWLPGRFADPLFLPAICFLPRPSIFFVFDPFVELIR